MYNPNADLGSNEMPKSNIQIITPNPNTKKIDLVNGNYQESLNYLQGSGYIGDWEDFFNLYRSIPKAKSRTWMSNKFMPLINAKVEAALSNLLGLFFAANPPFEVRPRESGDSEQARIMQKLLQYQFDEAGVYYEFAQFLRSLCIYGTAIGKVYWDRTFDYRTIWQDNYQPILNPQGMMIGHQYQGTTPETQKYLSFDGPRFINCNISDIFPEPTSIEIQDGWIIHRTFRSREYLNNMHKHFPDTYNEEVLKLSKEDGSNTNEARRDTTYATGRAVNPPVTRPDGTELIPLLERWGLDIDPQDGVLKERVETVAAGKYLIRSTNNPYWCGKKPFVKGVYIPSINDFYGIGIPEICEDLQKNVNDMVNQTQDNVSLALNRIILYKKGAGITIENLKSEPGIKIGANEDINTAIKFLETPLYTRDAYQNIGNMERWMQEATAVTKLTLGTGGTEMNDTATGMTILQRASGDRFMAVAKVIEFTAFRELIKQFYELDYQYIDQEQMIRIVGESANEFVKVTPEDVRRNFDFIPSGIFTMENKGQKMLRLIQFKNITKDDPTIKQNELNKKIYYAAEVGDSPNEIMRTDGEMQEIMRVAQMMAMQMVQQQMAQMAQKEGGQLPSGKSGNSGQFNGSQVGTPGVPPPTVNMPPTANL